MRKRLRLIGIFVLILSSLYGCNNDTDYETPYEMKVRYMQTIMDSIINRETEPIEELFCSYVRDTHTNLESEIVAFFDFIDGEIISYDEPKSYGKSGKMRGADGVVEETMNAYISNVTTSEGKKYTIAFGGYRVYKEFPEYEGITELVVRDEDTYDPENGYPEEGVYEIYSPEMWE